MQLDRSAVHIRAGAVHASDRAASSFHAQRAPYVWGMWPDIEDWADNYVSYACTKVTPFPVRRAGNPSGTDATVGHPRRIGLYRPSDPAVPQLLLFGDLFKQGLKRCGVRWEVDATYARAGYAPDFGDPGTDAARAIAAFRQAGVTTVLYLGSVEVRLSQAAAATR